MSDLQGKRSRTRPRQAVAVPMVVALALFLVVVITPFLLLSGSQTRSMGREGDLTRARQLARSGLEAAADRLRKERWYGETSFVGSFDSSGLLGEGLGRFQVVCEDARVFSEYEREGFQSFPMLHHIDVFSRGEVDGVQVVAYGAFVMNPAPELAGTSTDGFSGGIWPDSTTTSDTLKRLVRISYYPEPALQGIEGQGVRDAIRSRVQTESVEYLENYAQVDWSAMRSPPSPPVRP